MADYAVDNRPSLTHTGSHLTAGHDVGELLSHISDGYKQSKANQILRLLKDQDKLNIQFSECELLKEYDQIKEDNNARDSDTLSDDSECASSDVLRPMPRGGRCKTSMGFHKKELVNAVLDSDSDSGNMAECYNDTRFNRPKSSYVRRRHYRKVVEMDTDVANSTEDDFRAQPPQRAVRSAARPKSRLGRSSIPESERVKRKIVLTEAVDSVPDEPLTILNEDINAGGNTYDRFANTRTPVNRSRREKGKVRGFCDESGVYDVQKQSIENMSIGTNNSMDIREEITEIQPMNTNVKLSVPSQMLANFQNSAITRNSPSPTYAHQPPPHNSPVEPVSRKESLRSHTKRDQSPRYSHVNPEPLRKEVLRQEPSRYEQVRQEPSRYEQVRQDPVRQDPLRQEPSRYEQVRQDPVRQEPHRYEQVRQDPVRQEPSRYEQVRQDPVRQEPPSRYEQVRQDPVRQEPPSRYEQVRQDPVRQEPSRYEQVRQDPVRQEPPRYEQVRQDPVLRQESVRMETTRHEPLRTEPHADYPQSRHESTIHSHAPRSERPNASALISQNLRPESNSRYIRPKNPEPIQSRPMGRAPEMRQNSRRRFQRRFVQQAPPNPHMSNVRPTSESVILARQRTEKNLLKAQQEDNRPKSEKIIINTANKTMLSVSNNPAQGPATSVTSKSGVPQASHIQNSGYRGYDPGNTRLNSSRTHELQGELTLPRRQAPNNVLLGARQPLTLMKLPSLEASVAAKKKERALQIAARETCV